MSDRDKKYRREKRPVPASGMDFMSEHISREKQKARKLRTTPWWKKKISTGICYYCSGKFSPADLTMDHRIPLARGGMSDRENIVPACKECNNRKKNLLPVEWDEYMKSLKSADGE